MRHLFFLILAVFAFSDLRSSLSQPRHPFPAQKRQPLYLIITPTSQIGFYNPAPPDKDQTAVRFPEIFGMSHYNRQLLDF